MGYSNHWMGGEITWQCDGNGQYIFTLKIHRDCSGPAVNTVGQLIKVWGNPGITQIPVNYVQTNEVSPSCREVSGGPEAISCGSNQIPGAAEEYVFKSSPTTLSGVPPATGWAFTWDNVTRNSSVSNLVSPNTKGITLRAVMYSNGGANGNPCYDSSPEFIESPSSIICAGTAFTYSPNAFDKDLDSLVFSFGQPLDAIQNSYNPPSDPAAINYVSGYSLASPLPGKTQNANNIPATINSATGEINFTSNTLGSFAVVVRVQSYRCGVLLAEVYREMQIIIINCSPNNPPTAIPPFKNNTSYFDTVTAGDLVTFDFSASDFDLMQDNSNQFVEIAATGAQFGLNFNTPFSGCENPPCATLSPASPISNAQNATTTFTWQTSCDHLKKNLSSCGGNFNSTYVFVFRVKDDFCPAPAVKYYSVSITVVPPANLPAPTPKCVNVLSNGDVELTWDPVFDENNIFQSYDILASTNGGAYTAIGSITNKNTTTYTHSSADANTNTLSYKIATTSACNLTNYSEVIRPMRLNINNPNTGEAVLQWNAIFSPTNSPTSNGKYYVFKEYPSGTWTLVDSTLYGVENYRDTITVCEDSIYYRIETYQSNCVSTSTVSGDLFKDMLPPAPPIIRNVSIDSATGIATVCWYKSRNKDTQGYIILRQIGTTWQIIDTVYANDSLCYTDVTNANAPIYGPECYGVAAFDSCWSGTPMSPNTSAMGISHCSMHLNKVYDVCDKSITLTWTPYTNWVSGVKNYFIYYQKDKSEPELVTSTTGNENSVKIEGILPNLNYCFYIQAVSNDQKDTAISNRVCIDATYPMLTDTNYLSTASVINSTSVEINVFSETNASILGYQILRSENGTSYTPIGIAPFTPPISSFIDANATKVSQKNYYYKARAIDSCNYPTDSVTNVGKTILLLTNANSSSFTNNLNWNNYSKWNGGVSSYDIYRKIGDAPYSLVANVPFGTNNYQDDVSSYYNQDTKGSFCYQIKANENTNSYNFAEESYSNESCTAVDYLLFVPNAFTPNGINPIFKPSIGFANFESYDLYIYNRIYKEVFHTTDVNQGWDGTYKDKPAPEGIYIYFIQFRDAKGQPYEKSGHLMLIKN